MRMNDGILSNCNGVASMLKVKANAFCVADTRNIAAKRIVAKVVTAGTGNTPPQSPILTLKLISLASSSDAGVITYWLNL